MINEKISALAGKQEIIITRTFAAPREKVFRVTNDPKLIPAWWGPRNLTTLVDRLELKPGGIWRFVQHDAEGHEFAFQGVYHLVQPPERLIYTFEYEGTPGHVLLITVDYAEVQSGTVVTEQSVFQSVQDRDDMLQAGMERGETESMERLAELLIKV